MNFPAQHDPTNADATPDYDGLGWDSQWSAEDWVAWHRALKERFGQAEANRIWLNAWNGGGIFEEPPIDARSFNAAFKAYARENGFFDALFSGLGVLAKPVSAANDVIDGVTDLSAGVKGTAKTVGAILPVVALAGLAFLAWRYLPRIPAFSK
jgi:hypothetical protein